jgi:hypothetical protein
MFELIVLFITMIILYSVSIFSSYVSSKVTCDGVVNEDNKKIITPIYVTNFVIQILFVVYMIITKTKLSEKYTVVDYITLFFVTIGIIISLIYIAQRDN